MKRGHRNVREDVYKRQTRSIAPPNAIAGIFQSRTSSSPVANKASALSLADLLALTAGADVPVLPVSVEEEAGWELSGTTEVAEEA